MVTVGLGCIVLGCRAQARAELWVGFMLPCSFNYQPQAPRGTLVKLLGLLQPEGRMGWIHDLLPCCPTALDQGEGPSREHGPGLSAMAFPCLCRALASACAIPSSPEHQHLSVPAPPCHRQGLCLWATALASDCEVSAHLGHSSVVSLIKAAEANHCHMLGMT